MTLKKPTTGLGVVQNTLVLEMAQFPNFHGNGVTSDADAIEDAIESFNLAQLTNSELSGGYCELTFPPYSKIALDRSISIPFNLAINFQGSTIIPLPGLGGSMSAFYGGRYMFLLNANTANGNQIVNYSGNQVPLIHDGYFQNPNNAVDAIAFWGRSKHSHKRMEAHGIRQYFKKDGGSATEYDYTDMLSFEDINFGKFQDTTDYPIELSYHGDAVYLKNVHIYKGSTGTLNKRLLKLDRTQGATFVGQINGDVYIRRAQAIHMSGGHTEFGIFDFEAANVTVSNYSMWMHPEAAAAGYMMKIFREASDKPSGMVTLDNVLFRYLTDRHGLTQAAAQPDFTDVLVDVDALVTIRNCYREFNSDIGPSLATKTAIKVGYVGGTGPSAAWEDFSSAYSKDSQIVGGIIKSRFNSIQVPTSVLDPTLGSESAQGGVWKEATGTYTYRVQYLFGPKNRKVGLNNTATFVAAMTNGAGTRKLYWPRNLTQNLQTGVMTARVYRSIAGVDQYNAYVDIPVGNLPDFYDTGFMLATGERWIARTAGVVDSVNIGITELALNEKTAVYIGGTEPNAGGFINGDVFRNTSLYEEWTRDAANSRWLPTSPVPQIFTNPITGNVGGTYGWYIASFNNTVLGADRVLTLTAGSKKPYMRRKLSRKKTCTGAFNVSYTDGTTTWSLGLDTANDQALELYVNPVSGNWELA